jgi:hypothetical protein
MRDPRAFVRRDVPSRILPVVCVVAISMLFGTKCAKAQWTTPIANPSTDFTFGMVGLGPSQTARLNIVNIGVATGSPLPCVLALAFLDSNSKVLKQTFVSIKSGQSALLDLTANEAGLNEQKPDSAQRVQIRGVGYNPLLAPGSAIPQPLSCNLVPTLELFDAATGRTVTVLGDFTRSNG